MTTLRQPAYSIRAPLVGASPRWRALAAALGPGLVVMLADTDAGNVVTAAQGGARWGYRLLPLILLLIPMLYMLQDLTLRLGIFTQRGHAELIRERFGVAWAWASMSGLTLATIGSLVTEFSAIAAIGEIHGLTRAITLPAAAAMLLVVAATGSYRRVERTAIIIGLFELAFLIVAWVARPDFATVAKDAISLPLGDRGFVYMLVAIVGATFNPWMIFYQQSAVVDKGLMPRDYPAGRWDTGFGAVLTQLLTAAVLVSVAARPGSDSAGAELSSVGEIVDALTPALGERVGSAVFSLGVLGAALVAAIVSSLALAWGIGEAAGYRRSLECRPSQARWFYGVHAACLVTAAALVWSAVDLIWLNIAAQVLNVFLLPLVIGVLLKLALTALPERVRPKGWYKAVLIGSSASIVVLGAAGGTWALL
jgi:NRAMP (natural resistance-associated macrophage protein)-like metal ion transporter